MMGSHVAAIIQLEFGQTRKPSPPPQLLVGSSIVKPTWLRKWVRSFQSLIVWVLKAPKASPPQVIAWAGTDANATNARTTSAAKPIRFMVGSSVESEPNTLGIQTHRKHRVQSRPSAKTSSRAWWARLESFVLRSLFASRRHVEGHAGPQHQAGVVGLEFRIGALIIRLGVRDLGDAITGSTREGEPRTHRPLTHAHEVETNGAAAEIDVGRSRALDLSAQ